MKHRQVRYNGFKSTVAQGILLYSLASKNKKFKLRADLRLPIWVVCHANEIFGLLESIDSNSDQPISFFFEPLIKNMGLTTYYRAISMGLNGLSTYVCEHHTCNAIDMGSRASTRPRAHPGAYVSLIMSDTSNWL
jgi:hypothetical protein